MKAATVTRKKRSDRNHVLYIATAPDGEFYVGLTVCDLTPLKSMRRRWMKHVNRASNDGKDWALCQAIRVHGGDRFVLEILEKVRGKAAAHAREVELIRGLKPSLNTARTGKSS
jgi:predicted GIY-YIG superfamily endonuclease